MKVITAEDATRQFPSLLSGVQSGETYAITQDGQEIARLIPLADKSHHSAQVALLQRWASRSPLGLPKVSREEAYDT